MEHRRSISGRSFRLRISSSGLHVCLHPTSHPTQRHCWKKLPSFLTVSAEKNTSRSNLFALDGIRKRIASPNNRLSCKQPTSIKLVLHRDKANTVQQQPLDLVLLC